MRIIAVCSTKGGVGKTTISASLGVEAGETGNSVVLADLDPQESLRYWWMVRGEPENPLVIYNDIEARRAAEDARKSYDPDWLILDGPPGFLNSVEEMVRVADLVVVPTKTSMIDLLGSESAISEARKQGKPCLVVLNDVHADGMEISASQFLKANKIPMAKTMVKHRVAHVRALSVGKVASEIDGGRHKAAAKDISDLWREIRTATNKAVKVKS